MSSLTKVEDFRASENVDFHLLFRPFLKVARFIGIHRVEVSKDFRYKTLVRLLNIVQILIIQLLIWLGPIKFIYNLIWTLGGNIGRFLSVLVAIFFLTGAAFISTSSSIMLNNNFTKLCDALQDHQNSFGTIKISWFSKFLSKWIHILSIIFAIGVGVTFSTVIFLYRQDLADIMPPLKFDTTMSIGISWAFLLFQGAFVSSHMVSLLFLYIIVCGVFIGQFTEIKKKLEKHLGKDKILGEAFIGSIRQEFSSLLCCFEIVNSIYQHFLASLYASFVPMVCFMLFGVSRGNMSVGEAFMVCSMVAINYTTLEIMAIMGAVLTVRAHDPLDILLNADLESASLTTNRSVSLFVARLTGPSIGFTIYDMITVDAKSILTLFGSLVTYVIVMIQFSETGSTSDFVGSNQTSPIYG